MKKCTICGTTDEKRRIYNNKVLGVVCNRCYHRHKNSPVIYEPSKYGEISYNDDGKPICHICGRAYNKLLSHVQLTHGINAYDYKKKFGLETTKGIMSKTSHKLARENNLENYETVIKNNLNNGGKNTRFKKGYKGRTRDEMCEQTRLKLSKRLIKMNGGKVAN